MLDHHISIDSDSTTIPLDS